MICIAITRVTVHLVNTIASSTRIKATIINDFAHLFIAQYFHLEIRNVVATVICVLIDTLLVRVATVASNGLPLDQGTVFVEPPLYLNCPPQRKKKKRKNEKTKKRKNEKTEKKKQKKKQKKKTKKKKKKKN